MLKCSDVQKRSRRLTAVGYILLTGLVAGIFFDYYYDLNDDVLMKDIMAGAYTGTPSGYNIQMLYPISAFISLLYRIMPGAAWYGLFLCMVQFFCLYLICIRLLAGSRVSVSRNKDRRVRMYKQRINWGLLCAMQFLLVYSLLLRELVNVQYTVTCALLCGTAAFWFYTMPKADLAGYYKQNIVSILLVTLAFQIRTEMLVLTLPLVGVTGICRWWDSYASAKEHETVWYKQFFSREYLMRYVGLAAAVCLGLLLSLGMNRLAYGGSEWREFQSFFDSRTQIYDFYGIPDYETHRDFYESIDMDREQWQLLENYNFGLDKRIDDDTLEKIAAYAKGLFYSEHPFWEQLKKALWNYRQRLTKLGDAPWNICIIAAYLLLTVLGIVNRSKNYIWQLPLLFLTRSSLWLFILYRERAPERITHSLYLVEFFILAAFLWEAGREPFGKHLRLVTGIVLTACAVSFLPAVWKNTAAGQRERADKNQDYAALQEYCRNNSDNYYLVDVYSTTVFSEKMFDNVDNSMKNYDIIGGWASKSPVNQAALAVYGIQDTEKALLENTNLYFLSDSRNMDGWLEAYYQSRGIKIQALPIKKLDNTVYKDLTVYQVRTSTALLN